MRKSLAFVAGVALLACVAVTTRTVAADKAVTISGEGKCAKCALKETEECQNVIQTKKGGKEVTYYLVQNDMSKDFHHNICKGPKKVTATGTVKEVDGKMELTVTKIELAKSDK
jgi:RecG-like helicase